MNFEVTGGLPSKTCKICNSAIETNSDFCKKCHKQQKLIYEKNLYQKLRTERLAAGLCVKCGKTPSNPPLTRCDGCRIKRVSYKTEKRIRYITEGKCNNCGASPVSETCKELCESCRQLAQVRARELAHKDKVTVMTHYGQSACVCCGEKALEFLTIDHIKGNGSTHRKILFDSKDTCGEKFYRWLIKNGLPAGYQVMCFNCNYGKHLNGSCPHKTVIVPAQTWQQEYGERLKRTAMAAYGNQCNCCKETCLLFLTIDHINGRTDKLRGDKLYRWLAKNNFPEGFQVLCFNCNISKYLSGRCVHFASLV